MATALGEPLIVNQRKGLEQLWESDIKKVQRDTAREVSRNDERSFVDE